MFSSIKETTCWSTCSGLWLENVTCFKSHRIVLKGKLLKIPRNLTIPNYLIKQLLSNQIDGNKPAIIYEKNLRTTITYTFSTFDDLSTRLAKSIKKTLEERKWISTNADGDIVIAFCLDNTDRMILTVFAILKLGATYLPIDPACPEENLKRIFGTVKPVMIIIEKKSTLQTKFNCVAKVAFTETINKLFDYALSLPLDLNNVIPLNGSFIQTNPIQRAALICYSAGLGGQLRGSRIGHIAIFNRIMWQWDTFPYDENDIACLITPATSHTSIPDIFAPLLFGIPLVLLNKKNNISISEHLIRHIAEKQISRITVSSEILASILKIVEFDIANYQEQLHDDEKSQGNAAIPVSPPPATIKVLDQLARISIWVCCGDSLTTELCEKFFKLFHSSYTNISNNIADDAAGVVSLRKTSSNHSTNTPLTNVVKLSVIKLVRGESIKANSFKKPILVHIYGATETTADCTYETFENVEDLRSKLDSRGRIPLGIPIANTTVFLMNVYSTSKVLKKGLLGEICVAGLSLACGYVLDTGTTCYFFKNPTSKLKDYSTMFRSRDIGRVIESKDGEERLYFEGRCDSIIKFHGKQIDLNDVAEAILATGLVTDTKLFIFRATAEEQAIVAATILKAGVLPNAISQAIQDSIAKDTIPEIFPVDEFPLFPDGRLDRHKLKQNYKHARKTFNPNDWNIIKVTPEKKEAVKTLCTEVASSLGVSIKFVVSNFQDSYWNLGGTSQNTVILIERLASKNYTLSLDDFISSANLPEILDKMKLVMTDNKSMPSNKKSQGLKGLKGGIIEDLIMPCTLARSLYTIEPLADGHKNEVSNIICSCYPEKSDLALHVSAEYTDYQEFLDDIWDSILKQNLSFVAVSKRHGTVVGVNFVIDPNSNIIKSKKIDKPIRYIYELFEYCEKSSKARLPLNEGRLIQPFMIGTVDTISSNHNVLITQLLLKETIDRGKSAGFTHLFLMGTLPIVKQFCQYIFNCDMVFEYPIFDFVASDKSKPFYHAGIIHTCKVFAKRL